MENNMIAMTIRKETTDLFSKDEIRDESFAELEFPRDIVEAFFDEKIRPMLDAEKDETGCEIIGFDEWLDMYDADDTEELYSFAKKHGYKAGYPTRKESVLQEFVDKAKMYYDGRSFRIYANEQRMWFTQMYIGDARLIYGYIGVPRMADLPRLENRPELVAIGAHNMVYFMENPKYNYFWGNPSDLPKHSALFCDAKAEYRETLLHELEPLVEEAEAIPYEDEDGMLERDARANVLFGDNVFSLDDLFELTDNKVFLLLANLSTARDILRNDKKLMESLPHMKGKQLLYQKLVLGPNLVKDWEKQIASAISSNFKTDDALSANVTVEFNFKGKSGSGKIQATKIKRAIISRDVFRDYFFSCRKAGKELFDNVLMVPTYGPYPTCADITRISYRGKHIYEK